MNDYTIHVGDVRASLRAMPEQSVHCAVTSPPYWGLRSYLPVGHPDKGFEIGSEPTPDAFVETMVGVFREVRRVLRDDGVLGLNIGDSYAKEGVSGLGLHTATSTTGKPNPYSTIRKTIPPGLKAKDLCMIPWRVFLALQADGWYLRSIIAWTKPAPMPESCTDRPTSSWEPIALLTKSPTYFWDADAVRTTPTEAGLKRAHCPSGAGRATEGTFHDHADDEFRGQRSGAPAIHPGGSNIRNTWRISSEPWTDPGGVDLFAAAPTEIPRRFVKAGTSEKGCCPKCGAGWERETDREQVKRERPNNFTKRTGEDGTGNSCGNTVAGVSVRTTGWAPACTCNAGDPIPCTVLDPFSGTGSTGVAACTLGRRYVGCELFPQYAEMGKRRIEQALHPATFRCEPANEDAGLFGVKP